MSGLGILDQGQKFLELEVERLREIAGSSTYSERRQRGAATFYLPDVDEKPVTVDSMIYRTWLIRTYEKRYGHKPTIQAVKAFINAARFNSLHPGCAVPKIKSSEN